MTNPESNHNTGGTKMQTTAAFTVCVFPAGAGEITTLYPVRRYTAVGNKASAINAALGQYRNAGLAPNNVALDYSLSPIKAEVGQVVASNVPVNVRKRPFHRPKGRQTTAAGTHKVRS